jgi:hypothetical protein
MAQEGDELLMAVAGLARGEYRVAPLQVQIQLSPVAEHREQQGVRTPSTSGQKLRAHKKIFSSCVGFFVFAFVDVHKPECDMAG